MRRTRIWATLAMLIASLLTVVAPASPARADFRIVYCDFLYFNGRIIAVRCWDLDEITVPRLRPDPCLSCPYLVDLKVDVILPQFDADLVAGGIVDGVRQLLAATVASDPQERAALRKAGIASYTSAAAHLGQAKLALGGVRSGDPNPEPGSLEAFRQYGLETITGLDQLRAGNLKAAVAAFDRGAAAFLEGLQQSR